MFTKESLMPWSKRGELSHGKRDDGHPMDLLHRDIDRLFEDFWRGFDLPMLGHMERPFGRMLPKLDMAEDEDEVRLSVELPGMDEKDVEVLLSDNVLTIKGEKKAEKETKKEAYAYTERTYGSFHRSIPLDAEVMADKVEARFDKGVLTVTLPKTPEAKTKAKKIPVNVSAKVKKMEHKAA